MRADTDRRSTEDRRSHKRMPKGAFTDSEGVKVTRDRRRAPDRRINVCTKLRLFNPLQSRIHSTNHVPIPSIIQDIATMWVAANS